MPATGTMIPKRVCSTAEEWAAFDRQQQEQAEEIRNAGSDLGPPPDPTRFGNFDEPKK
jgi:hypothetical protein